jgi:thiol-disulfide isomerase/thioredoxin
MPSFRAPGVSGGPVAWSPGSPTAVAVWAPWCPHCQEELPVVAEVVAEYPGLELVSVATAIGDQPSRYTPASYMLERGLSFPVALDDARDTIGSGLGITGFPTLYVVDADGIVRAAASGEIAPDGLREMFAQVA